ncbi:ribonuclease-3 family protein [Desulfitispora alkaliphila]
MALKADQQSPLVLAYVGDAVYELYVRTHLLEQGAVKMNELHKTAVKYVKATAQANILKQLEGELSEEEYRIVKRGRNAKSQVPKNTEVVDYRYSTGFESLIGYLHLNEDKERLNEILEKSVAVIDEEER